MTLSNKNLIAKVIDSVLEFYKLMCVDCTEKGYATYVLSIVPLLSRKTLLKDFSINNPGLPSIIN